jgi:gluconolactonase
MPPVITGSIGVTVREKGVGAQALPAPLLGRRELSRQRCCVPRCAPCSLAYVFFSTLYLVACTPGRIDLQVPAVAQQPNQTPAAAVTPAAPPVDPVYVSVAAACPAPPFAQPMPSSITFVAAATLAVDQLDGPVWSSKLQVLLFSAWNALPDDGLGVKTGLYQLSGGAYLTALSPPGALGTRCFSIDANNLLVATTVDRREISQLSLPQLQRQPLATGYANRPFNAPRDLALRSSGHLYFTDPDDLADGRSGQPATRVYGMGPDGQVFVVDAARSEPTGIELSPDEAWLYIAGADAMVQRYPVHRDGTIGPSQMFAYTQLPAAGMGVDCAGNLYAAVPGNNTIVIISPGGGTLGVLSVPESPSNVAFGDADHKTLYVTTTHHIYSLRMPVPGLPS